MPYPTRPYLRPPIADPIAAAREFVETLKLRRTVRDFAPDPVPDEVLRLAIEAAHAAPSGANQQPWTFVVVRDPEVKSASAPRPRKRSTRTITGGCRRSGCRRWRRCRPTG